jgi:catechol 2,3-dioxygenase-like lactoylglutathione lyase family enzyme
MVLRNTDVFTSFSVDDLDAAYRFFGETLGLDVRHNPMGLLEINMGEGRHVAIYPKENHEPATYTVLNFVVASLDETVGRLIDAGVEMEQYDMPGLQTDERGIVRESGGPDGPAMAWFKDPAGNIHSVVELP